MMASHLPHESCLMRGLKRMGLKRLAWSLRRLYCPVSRDALVLEVGSGGNPYARANVLMDAYECTRERHWAPLVSDRPTALGFVERLPFKDQYFDFVIASHVLEHSTDPERFLSEIQRVGKAGYIEVPDAFFERLNPYKDHRLEITCTNNRLVIRKKKAWVQDQEVVDLYENRVNVLFATRLIPENPFDFHVRYYWQDTIDFTVLNPAYTIAWDPDPVVPGETNKVGISIKGRINAFVLSVFRFLFSQRTRNKNLDIFDMLICPECGSEDLRRKNDELVCGSCASLYAVKNGIPKMI